MIRGTVIFLNGTSSSGKTSISNELIRILNDDDFMYLSVDHAINGVNDMLLNMFGKHITRDEVSIIEHKEIIENSVISLFHHYILAFSMLGKNIVVDHVLIDPKWLQECILLLDTSNTYLIGVHCPLQELERRERTRGDRPVGLAKAQYTIVHKNIGYDLEVNTFTNSIEECSKKIKDFIMTIKPKALQVLKDAK